MRLALNVGHFGMGFDGESIALVQEAERLGYRVVWAAEAYGSDVISVLSWIGAQTSTIGLGSGVMQIPARTPAMTAMTAATVDTLSGGRFHLGLGVSGPQVSEGWHGVRFAEPLGRTREYVDIVRRVLRRDQLDYAGRHYVLPLPDGPGKALRLSMRPPRADLPIYLAAVGPKNLELTGEIADGWLAIFHAPEHADIPMASIAAGLARRDPKGPRAAFDVCATVPVVVTDDLDAGRAAIAPYAALYIGGMGPRERNFYNQLAVRMGFDEAAQQIQDLYLARQHRDAAAAVPAAFLDQTSLIGPVDHIADRLAAYRDSGVTTLAVSPYAPDLASRIAMVRGVAEALDRSGLGD
ncbi:MAG: LLM class F420-dependent oxidoreductase [Phycicoccus sp.]|nr:LLM class F420-dependent oxidoreductase [Phycicoccus sp.]